MMFDIGSVICGIAAGLFLYKILCSLWTRRCPSHLRASGKTIIVTGANTGIGKQTALQLAQRGARVILACRSRERGEAAVGEISEKLRNVEDPGCVLFRQLDLASFKSIRQFAEQILSTEKQLHVLINNAGLAGLNERMKTEDGLEYEMGVNYFGHFYLTELLMDLLKKSAPSRIINVSSSWHWGGTLDPQNLNCEKHFQRDVLLSVFPVKQYVNSKLAQVSHTRQLARRLEGTGVSCYSLHPGWVASDAFRHVIWIFQPFVLTVTKLLAWNTDEGAQTSIFLAAVDKVPGKSGDFFFNCAVTSSKPTGEYLDLAVWNRTVEIIDNITSKHESERK